MSDRPPPDREQSVYATEGPALVGRLLGYDVALRLLFLELAQVNGGAIDGAIAILHAWHRLGAAQIEAATTTERIDTAPIKEAALAVLETTLGAAVASLEERKKGR